MYIGYSEEQERLRGELRAYYAKLLTPSVREDLVRGLRARGPVVEARGDDAHGSRNEIGRPRASDAMTRHIIHVAMTPGRKPVQKPRLRIGEIDVGNADRLESDFLSPRRNARAERSPVASKRVMAGHRCLRTRSGERRGPIGCHR